MTLNETLKQLKALGNATVRAQNAKSGAGDDQFGVSLGDIRVLAKKIRTNHVLALSLWDTGNVDAHFLATLLIQPKNLSADEMNRMVRSVTFVRVADWLNAYVVRQHPDKETLRQEWMATDDRWAARAGWDLTAERVAQIPDGLALPALLDRIESEMASADPEVQWTMNNTLAAIGMHLPKHRKRAIAIGEKLGIYRDYPVSKGCTSPFASIWINAIVSRQGLTDGLTMKNAGKSRSAKHAPSRDDQVTAYSQAQPPAFRAICDLLRELMDRTFPKATSKVWHGSPVWFIGDNPVVGYSANGKTVNLLFWNGQAFDEPDLRPVGEYRAAQATFGDAAEIHPQVVRRWLKKAKSDVFDSKAFFGVVPGRVTPGLEPRRLSWRGRRTLPRVGRDTRPPPPRRLMGAGRLRRLVFVPRSAPFRTTPLFQEAPRGKVTRLLLGPRAHVSRPERRLEQTPGRHLGCTFPTSSPGDDNVAESICPACASSAGGCGVRREPARVRLTAGPGPHGWWYEQTTRFHPRRLRRLPKHARSTRHQEAAQGA
jgi:3-methyladenine DNA glycosylase AlkD